MRYSLYIQKYSKIIQIESELDIFNLKTYF